MSSEASPPVGTASRGAGAQVSFERLEYGKLCKSQDGPIEPGVESYPLATSSGFSPLIEPLCRPWLVGVGAEIVANASHGTVLRCVRMQGRPVPLFCRLRQRPEGGEGAEGRRFWLGRYIYAGTVDPLTGFTALAEFPLRGITVRQTRTPWTPIVVPRNPRPEPDPRFTPILQTALEHILSGIPVGISGEPDEIAFFRWASLLWHLLPPALQPVFSAGWAVTPEVAQALSLSWSPVRSPAVAIVDLERATWTPPQRVELIQPAGEIRTRLFQDDLLVPGRMYLRESFEWSGGRARLDDASPRLDHLHGFDFGIRGAAEEPASVVDARSPWAWDRFRRPGARSLDHARLRLAQHWLATGKGEPAALCLSTKDYFFPDSRSHLLALSLKALENPEHRPRADQVVWRSLAQDPASREALDRYQLAERESSRARLFRALAGEDLQKILEALARAQELEGAVDLPPAAMDRLWEALAASLSDPALLGFHRTLLRDAEVAEPYRSWAAESSPALAVLLGTDQDLSSFIALDRLGKISEHPVIASMQRLLTSNPPTAGDVQVLGALAPQVIEQLIGRLFSLWRATRDETGKDNTKSRREWLCDWLQAVGPLETEDPLLALLSPAQGKVPLQREQRAVLAEEILLDHVPPMLQPQVAALALAEWRHLYEDYEAKGAERAGWSALFRYWTPATVLGLVGEGKLDFCTTPPEILALVEELSLPSPFLERRIQAHLKRAKNSRLHEEVSSLLWQLCARAIEYPGSPLIPDLCRGLIRGKLPAGQPVPPSESVLKEAARFARQNLTALPADLWDRLLQGWQILFVLDAAPQADVAPTKEQLEALFPFRSWLKEHLKSKEIHACRKERFEIATFSFHQVSYRPELWRPEYQESFLWAAFKAVPLSCQGSLGQALDAYNEAGEKGFVTHAISYFKHSSYKNLNPHDQKEVIARLARAVIEPLMRAGGLDPAYAADRLIEAASRDRSQGRIQFRETADRAVELRPDGESIVVASWFRDLLSEICSKRAEDKLLAVISRGRV